MKEELLHQYINNFLFEVDFKGRKTSKNNKIFSNSLGINLDELDINNDLKNEFSL